MVVYGAAQIGRPLESVRRPGVRNPNAGNLEFPPPSPQSTSRVGSTVIVGGAVMSSRQIADDVSAMSPAPDKLLHRGK
jgi:hypothetical protein